MAAIVGSGLFLVVIAVLAGVIFDGPDDSDSARAEPKISISYTPYTPEPLPTDHWDTSDATAEPTASEEPVAEETETSEPEQEDPGSSDNVQANVRIVTENTIYGVGPQASVGCQESSAEPYDRAQIEAYYAQIFDCLNAAWKPQVTEAGFAFRPPTVVTWSGSVDSPCGNYQVSFYCGQNETVYMKWDDHVNQYNKFPEHYQKVYARMFASFISAHEYGHHVQQLTGIMTAYWDLRYVALSQNEELRLSRRAELQASCLAAVFFGTNQPSYPVTGEARHQWMYMVTHMGDEYSYTGLRDHGSQENHGAWSIGAFRTEDPGSCNTWSASRSSVS